MRVRSAYHTGLTARLSKWAHVVLNSTGQAALQTFFQSGGVYVGVHSASACLYNDTTYRSAVGGELSSSLQQSRLMYHLSVVRLPPFFAERGMSRSLPFVWARADSSQTFVRLNDTHPATAPLPDRWTYVRSLRNSLDRLLTVFSQRRSTTSALTLGPKGQLF